MDTLPDEYKSDGNRAEPFLTIILQTTRDVTRWLIGLFTFTEEDKMQAGIHVRGEKRDG